MWRLTLLLAALLAAAGPASGDDRPKVYIPCRVLSVHDGDTITADVLFPWEVTLERQSVRCQGYDAWEVTRTRRTVKVTEDEIAKGAKARDALKGLLETADGVYLSPASGRDPYGRLPAFLFVYYDGRMVDVAAWMTEHKHVRE